MLGFSNAALATRLGRHLGRLRLGLAGIAALVLAGGLVAAVAHAQSGRLPRAGSSSAIVATYGVGGVLRSDGVLAQWRPDQKRWVDIDESFRLDGEKRNVLPLPVRASEVARMEGFGFLVTRSGACWLYNLDTNRWENIGKP